MTQDEIIEMWNSVIKYAPSEVRITEFAKLVAAKAIAELESQEPMAWYCCFQGQEEGEFFLFGSPNSERYPSQYKTPLYDHLPQRTWVGLTDEETSGFTQHEMSVVKYVNKVLQEKNT
jgi:hypothetical protein